MMIIDFHTHTFPDSLAARAIAQLSERGQVTPATDGTNTGLLASMQRAGVNYSVVMPIATRAKQVKSINDWALEVNRIAGLRAFGTLHPGQPEVEWQAEIDRLREGGVLGVKMHPDYQEFYVDDPAIVPLCRALADAGLLLLLHAGIDIGYPEPVHCPPPRLARLLDALPDLRIIAAHMGGYRQWDEVEVYLLGRDLYLDTCYSQEELGDERMTSLMRAHGIKRILFGTDSPWIDQTAAVAGIQTLPLTAEEQHAVLGDNARCLLHC